MKSHRILFSRFDQNGYSSFLSHCSTEASYTSKLTEEQRKYQDLLQKHGRMEEEYAKQLKCAEESRTQALEELTQMYEMKLQGKTHLLAQVCHKKPDEEDETGLRF